MDVLFALNSNPGNSGIRTLSSHHGMPYEDIQQNSEFR